MIFHMKYPENMDFPHEISFFILDLGRVSIEIPFKKNPVGKSWLEVMHYTCRVAGGMLWWDPRRVPTMV